jgi:hypothetical protein
MARGNVLKLAFVGGLLAGLIGGVGCAQAIAPGGVIVTGSGKLETRDFDLTNFTKIVIDNAFEATVTRGDSYLVRITADDNLFQYLEVNASRDSLHIGLKHNYIYQRTTQKTTITLPALSELTLDGGSRATASGFTSSNAMSFDLSGASQLVIDSFKAGNTTIEGSGAAQISGAIDAGDVQLEISGAARAQLEGKANSLDMEASGGSQAALSKLTATNANIRVSGGSAAEVNVTGTLNADISGGGRLTYEGHPTLGRVNVSGGGTIKER